MPNSSQPSQSFASAAPPLQGIAALAAPAPTAGGGGLAGGAGLILGCGRIETLTPSAFGARSDAGVVHVDRADWETLSGVPDEACDFVSAERVLQALARPSVALANWIRAVRPGGIVRLAVPCGDAGDLPGADKWRFVVQDPAIPETGANLMELLQVVCHLVEVERLAVRADGTDPDPAPADAMPRPRAIEAVLRKRRQPLAPVQSNHTPEIQVLGQLARRAIAARSEWRPMDEFQAILATGVLDATVVDLSRLYLLYQWLVSTLRLSGDCIEIGCYRGGTAKLMSETLRRRGAAADIHLFDTFEGMPDRLRPDEAGLKGCFADTSVEQVRRLLGNDPRAHIHPGVFPDSVPRALHDRPFRFAHIDVDIESSVRAGLEFVYPRLVDGGVIVIDDYGHAECPGATRAVEEFFADRPGTVVQMPLVSSAVVLKTPS